MELDALMQQRRSCRSFQEGREISSLQIREMVGAALLAPTWKNTESGRYYAALGDEMVKKVRSCLAPYNQERTAGASAYIVTAYVNNLSGHTAGVADNELGNSWGMYDLGLQNSYMLLKAKELGLDSLIMGMRDSSALKKALGIPENETVVTVIALGYAKGQMEFRPRKKADEVCTIL